MRSASLLCAVAVAALLVTPAAQAGHRTLHPAQMPVLMMQSVWVPEIALTSAAARTALRPSLATWAGPGDTVTYALQPGSNFLFSDITISHDQQDWAPATVSADGHRASITMLPTADVHGVGKQLNVTLHLLNSTTGSATSIDVLVRTVGGPEH